MNEHSELLSHVLESVSDDTPVNWELALGKATNEREASVLQALEDIAEITRGHLEARRFEESWETPALERWGQLQIEEKIGEGGYAEVYRARDPTLNRIVALKLFHPERVAQLSRDTLLNEGRGLARLRHENVVAVYGADDVDGRVGIWMEHVDGATLRDLIESKGRMGADEAVSIGRRLCDALAAVHAKEMIHGDVKAQNVIRQQGDEGGRIVLMDFSSTRSTDRSSGERDEHLMGTPLYMAPELWHDAKPDITSDIYSLGVLLYYLVTGTFPVRAETIEELRRAHQDRERVLLRDQRPDLPDGFVDVVERALAWRPEERFRSAGEMRRALDATVTPPLETTAPIEAVPSPWSPWARFGGALFGITLLGFVSSISWELFLQIPGEFREENVLDYLVWGLRFMVPIVLIWFALGGGLFVVAFLLKRTLAKLFPGFWRRTFGRARDRVEHWASSSEPLTVAVWTLAVSGGAFALITWSFWEVLASLSELRYAPPGADVDVSLLGPRGASFHQSRDIAYALLSLAVAFVLYRWLPALEARSPGDRGLRLARWGLAAVFGAALLLSAIPYRIVWQNRCERVTFDGHRAYEIASNDSEVVLYVPGADRRHRIVSGSDPRLERSSERYLENIFISDER